MGVNVGHTVYKSVAPVKAEVTDYGRGIFYIRVPHLDDRYIPLVDQRRAVGEALSEIKQGGVVTVITPDCQGSEGYAYGYWVSVDPR